MPLHCSLILGRGSAVYHTLRLLSREGIKNQTRYALKQALDEPRTSEAERRRSPENFQSIMACVTKQRTASATTARVQASASNTCLAVGACICMRTWIHVQHSHTRRLETQVVEHTLSVLTTLKPPRLLHPLSPGPPKQLHQSINQSSPSNNKSRKLTAPTSGAAPAAAAGCCWPSGAGTCMPGCAATAPINCCCGCC